MLDFSLSREMGPRWIIIVAGLGVLIAFALGLSNSAMFYAMLPKDENADILVFYQPTCPHCIAEIPTIKRLVSAGYKISAFNVFRRRDLVEKYGVRETPTIVISRTGSKLVGEQAYDRIVAATKKTKREENGTMGGCSINRGAVTCSPT